MGWLLNQYYNYGEELAFAKIGVNSEIKLKDYSDEQINLEILYFKSLLNIEPIQNDCLIIFNDMVIKRRRRKILKIKERICSK
jgi:hypothetical protein